MKHSYDELKMRQSLPLDVKVAMSCNRIREWVNEYGESGVYISFSGGKDSTVLMDLVRNKCGYKNVKAMFVDVPTQYPELREFVKKFDNVDIVKPKYNFIQVCEKYGFPIISKEVAETVSGAKKYLTRLIEDGTISTDRQIPYHYYYDRITGQGKYARNRNTFDGSPADKVEFITDKIDIEELADVLNERMQQRKGGSNQRLAIMFGWLGRKKIQTNAPEEDKSRYSQERYKYLLNAPFDISNKCCAIMKKHPADKYAKENDAHRITAVMASESMLRKQQWLLHGCNGFDMKNPASAPMSFWTENDVLEYIYTNNIKICSVYGDVIPVSNQLSFDDLGIDTGYKKKYTTTGAKRTGCMLCGFGCHLEKSPGRFELLKQTHPGMYGMLDKITNNGVTFREAIEWINEHGGLNIKL